MSAILLKELCIKYACRNVLALTICLLPCMHLVAQKTGHAIKIQIKGAANKTCILAHHYGKKQFVKDTLYTDDKGMAVIEGDKKRKGGIYLLAVAPQNQYFEFILGDDQHFSLKTEYGDFINKMRVSGSEENKVFYDYLQYVNARGMQINKLKERRKELSAESDSLQLIKEEIQELQQAINDYREDLVEKYPDLLIGKVMRAMMPPEIPEPRTEAEKADSFFSFHYMQQHFFDHIDFTDDRLLRTPVYMPKVKQYFNKYVAQHPDSINQAADFILGKAQANEELFKHTLVHLLNKYAKSKLMGMDAVYVHLVENYYATGKAVWADSTDVYRIVDRARNLKPILIGKQAPPIAMHNLQDEVVSLHSVQADYIILYFWDPDCGHCKKATPKLKKVYDKYRDKGVEVYAVNTQVEMDKWKNFIDKHNLDWINVADPYFKSNFRDQYDINSTPKIFLLDEEKKIIAKRIGVPQLDEFIARKLGVKAGDAEDMQLIEVDPDGQEHHELDESQ